MNEDVCVLQGKRLLGAAVLAAILASLLPGTAEAERVFLIRERVEGGGEATFGTCPDTATPPPAGVVCEDTYVLLFNRTLTFNGGSVAPPNAAWAVYTETNRIVFTTSEPIVTLLRWGFVDNVVASSDSVKLETASVQNVSVPMSDLSTFVFSGVWTAWSDRMVFGNNGPAIGVPVRHYTNRCTTFNAHAHQKFRFATMTGMLNGVSVHSYTGFDFGASIFYNHFSYLEISHGGPGCP